jgi:hypothetical protein
METLMDIEAIRAIGTITSVRMTSLAMDDGSPIAIIDYADADSVQTTHEVAQPLFDEQKVAAE